MLVPARRVRRVLYLAVGLFAAFALAYLLRRYGTEDIPAGYTVLEPEVPPGSTVLVDRGFDRGAPLAVGYLVSFRATLEDRPVKRFGRIVALAGSELEASEEGLALDGLARDFPLPRDLELPAVIPAGKFLVVYNITQEDPGRETRETRLVEKEDILSRILLPIR